MPRIVGTPTGWPPYLQHYIMDVPCCCNLDNHDIASTSTKENNLYMTMVLSQKAAIFLERVIEQNDQDLETSYRTIDEHKVKLVKAMSTVA